MSEELEFVAQPYLSVYSHLSLCYTYTVKNIIFKICYHNIFSFVKSTSDNLLF